MRLTTFLTEPPSGHLGPNLNATGVVEFAVKSIIPLMLLFTGLAIIAGARKGRMSENAGIVTNILIGCGVIAGAALFYSFAGQLTDLIFGGGS